MTSSSRPTIRATKNGPYVLTGDVRIVRRDVVRDDDGNAVGWKDVAELDPAADGQADDDGAVYLCRCGHSKNKPYCDGHHKKVGFDGTETAPTADYDELAVVSAGGGTDLGDAKSLCARSGFCTAKDTDVWRMIEDGGTDDRLATMVEQCPSGRLAHRPEDAEDWVEPHLPDEVVLVVDGQLHVTGGVEVSRSDGQPVEQRNRVSLCRCGRSRNKPLCDGSHAAAGFTDEE